MKKVSVIVSNTNTRDVLHECLENLRHLIEDCEENLEVIVVDNKSNDGSADMVKKDFPQFKLIVSSNYGLANGCNRGAEIASGDYYLFLGEDGFPREGTLPAMVDYMENHKDVGLATARLVLRDGTPDLDVHRRFPTPGSAFARLFMLGKIFPKSAKFNGYFMLDKDHSKEHEIEMCITHFMLIPKNVFTQVNGFDDQNYFVYGEDADMCYKIKESGYRLMYLPQFEAGHYKGASMGTRKETVDIAIKTLAWKNFMHFNATRAQRVFVKKFLQNKYSPIVIAFMIFGTYVLEVQRQTTETIKHLKKYGFKYIDDDYTRLSKLTLKQKFDF
ncbi:glycosyltransferase family 2 protein [candidate division WWE3 bacterium]|uniref:Glycosyltransferase family 2 protein n=1 Tax=candidate division WWE3 bacterium TaxID=2053526 RepID=A0A7X9HH13_UNCKA|nr:glycosyltransferase family 2 protein [candidate division WWE3 bacterium]